MQTNAITSLYAAFAHIPRPTTMRADPDTVSEGEIRILLDTPRDSLRGFHFGKYLFKAITTWGAAQDLQYYLPRALELYVGAEDLEHLPDIEFVLAKLSLAEWRRWPLQIQNAIEECVCEAIRLRREDLVPFDDSCAANIVNWVSGCRIAGIALPDALLKLDRANQRHGRELEEFDTLTTTGQQ